jgi:transcriptional regulator with XRE-family HTH domain
VEDLRVAFGSRVRALREERGLSQEALAARGDFHWTYVSDVERGKRAPSLDVIGRIARALEVTPAELFAPLQGRYRAMFRSSHRLGGSSRTRRNVTSAVSDERKRAGKQTRKTGD